jgi:hypothetical protein
MLTEEDLNRLDRYIVEKNKLHNRNLHGWGVVCGLEVVCHPCAGYVTVRPGHALSPCGEDIVVCRDDSVNVCELITECRDDRGRDWECDPPQRAFDPDCQDVVEDWVLAICYGETHVRKPVLSADTVSGARCSCGGASNCGCGGGSATCACGGHGSERAAARKTSGRRSPRTTAPACEPTVVCEGYRFKVYKRPPKLPLGRRLSLSEIVLRAAACEAELKAILTPVPVVATVEQLHAWCCDVKAKLTDFFAEHPTYDCRLYDRVAAIACPSPQTYTTPQAYRAALAPVVLRISEVAGEYYRYCRCSAQMPQCPGDVDSNCVPLATITVRRRGCQIQRVCNWGVRPIVLSFPLLNYWLSGVGVLDLASVEASCCEPFRPKVVKLPTGTRALRPLSERVAARLASTSLSPGDEYSAVLSHSWATRRRPVDEQALALAALGATDENDEPFASEVDLGYGVELRLIHQLLRPIAEALFPRESIEQIEAAAAGSLAQPGAPIGAPENEMASLRRTVNELANTVMGQADEIRRLRESRG